MTNRTDGLDAAGVEAAHVAYERYGQAGDLRTRRLSDGCIEAIVSAYLEATRRSALVDAPAGEAIETYYARQIEWSRDTFGPSLRTRGVIDHIRKELGEIEADPHDLSEWVDVIILAMDGFWRHGGAVTDLMPRLLAKQVKNMARNWPDWRSMSEDQAIEHDRSSEALASPPDTETTLRLDAAVQQLTRYGGEPDLRVLELVEILTDINDDIWNTRNLQSSIAKARKKLDDIEHQPERRP